MPNTAAPWSLWYPGASQRPRQGTEDLLLLANSMDYHMGDWRADDDRLRKRPAAKLSYNSTVRYVVNSTFQATIRFNTVELDTGGMTDLQRRNDRIYLPRMNRPGLFLVGGSINGAANNLSASTPDVRITSNAIWAKVAGTDYPFTTRDAMKDRSELTQGEHLAVSTIINSYQAARGGFLDEIWVGMEINSNFNYTVRQADMYAFWVTDVGSIPQS